MDHFQGITAEIISNGQVLTLYDDPDAAENGDFRSRHHYVEAVAGSTFQVKVNLTRQFNFYEMKAQDAILFRVKIDGNLDSSALFTKQYLQRKFSRGKLGSYTFTGLEHVCKENGQWMWSDYSFGSLVLKDSSDSGISVEQAQDLGKIQIIIRRVSIEKRRATVIPSATVYTTIDEVPEKALKGRPIETIVRLANTRPIVEPSGEERWRSVPGEAGKPLEININYRSNRALQMLGCIARTPSLAISISDEEAEQPLIEPENDISLTDSSTDQTNTTTTAPAHFPNDLLRQIQILNTRITDLERGKAKAEATNTDSTIKDEAVSVKRERKDDGGNRGSRQRRRTLVNVEHVDLTGD